NPPPVPAGLPVFVRGNGFRSPFFGTGRARATIVLFPVWQCLVELSLAIKDLLFVPLPILRIWSCFGRCAKLLAKPRYESFFVNCRIAIKKLVHRRINKWSRKTAVYRTSDKLGSAVLVTRFVLQQDTEIR